MLVATHARRHLPEQEERVLKQALAAAPKRPASDRVVVRKVDRNGFRLFGEYLEAQGPPPLSAG